MNIIKRKSGELLGRVLRTHNVFLTNIIEGRINGYKGKGPSEKPLQHK